MNVNKREMEQILRCYEDMYLSGVVVVSAVTGCEFGAMLWLTRLRPPRCANQRAPLQKRVSSIQSPSPNTNKPTGCSSSVSEDINQIGHSVLPCWTNALSQSGLLKKQCFSQATPHAVMVSHRSSLWRKQRTRKKKSICYEFKALCVNMMNLGVTPSSIETFQKHLLGTSQVVSQQPNLCFTCTPSL